MGLVFFIHSASLCLLVGAFNPFTFKVIIDIYVPIQRRKWQPTPVLLPGKYHGWRSLVGYSPWGLKESDRTERLHFLFFSNPGTEPGSPALQVDSLISEPQSLHAFFKSSKEI